MMKKLSYKDYSKRIATRDSGSVQSHDKEESKSNITMSANSTIIIIIIFFFHH